MSAQPDFTDAKAQLVAMAEKSGVVISGVADADAFNEAPEGRRPGDILPKARSVFVIGGAQPRAGDWQSPNYQHMEVTTTSDRIQTLTLKFARTIEATASFGRAGAKTRRCTFCRIHLDALGCRTGRRIERLIAGNGIVVIMAP